MTYHDFIRLGIFVMLPIWFALVLGWGGGDPNHPDHNPPPPGT